MAFLISRAKRGARCNMPAGYLGYVAQPCPYVSGDVSDRATILKLCIANEMVEFPRCNRPSKSADW